MLCTFVCWDSRSSSGLKSMPLKVWCFIWEKNNDNKPKISKYKSSTIYISELAKKIFWLDLEQYSRKFKLLDLTFKSHIASIAYSYKIDKKECSKYFLHKPYNFYTLLIQPFVYLSDRLITIIPYLKIGGPVRWASPALRYFCIKQPPADAAFLWKASSVMVAEVTLISGLVFLLFCSELPLGGAWGPPLPAPLGAENWRIKPVTLFLIDGMFKHV